jgi:hypothetical protein
VPILGCSVVKQTNEHERNEKVALSYFLPKGLITITAKKGEGGTIPERVQKTLVTETTTDPLDPSKVTTKTISTEDVIAGTPPSKDTIKISAVKIVADRSAGRKYARYVPNYLQDDDINLEVSATSGLLQTASATTKDQTGEIIVTAAQLAANAFVPMPFDTSVKVQKGGKPPGYNSRKSFEMTIDPSDETQRSKLNAELNKWGYSLEATEVADSSDKTPKGTTDKDPLSGPGILVRELGTFDLVCTWRGKTLDTPEIEASIISPDKNRTALIPINRGFLIEKTTKLKLENGVLTGITVKKPSEVLAFVQLPGKVLSGFFSGLKGAFQNTTIIHQGNADVLTARANAIDAELRLRAAQKKLAETEGL